MAKGPKGERRPADLNRRAFDIVRIASGEASDPDKPPRGRKGGMAGGKARAASLDKKRRKEIASVAAKTRWAKE